MTDTFSMSFVDHTLLDFIRIPALIVSHSQVTFANSSARELLGAHIVGEDVRIAIRNPNAISVILEKSGGVARVDNLSVGGSVWQVDCRVLNPTERLVTLYDLTIQVSVARSHADFVANASHELRTPLATIVGYVETLMDPRAGGDEATRTRFLETIVREAHRMQALVADLMSLSRIEAIKHDPPSGDVNMAALAREVVGELSAGEQVEVVTNLEAPMIVGDRGQMAQVMRNLIDNALKYGRPDGRVSVALEATPTGWLEVSVRDDGEGIPPEHLPRLTERFYRPDTSRSRAAGGTGLGLSIVKHVVERHRGRLDITSRLGQGTTVAMMLPLASNA